MKETNTPEKESVDIFEEDIPDDMNDDWDDIFILELEDGDDIEIIPDNETVN